MKVLEPIPVEDIPARFRSPHDYAPLYEQVLGLDGLALPIEFEEDMAAVNFAAFIGCPGSKAKKLGLAVKRRRNVVFLYRRDA